MVYTLNGQVVQFLHPINKEGQMVWAPQTLTMQPGSDSLSFGSKCKESSPSDRNTSVPRPPQVGTWFKKMPSIAEEGSEEPRMTVSNAPVLDDAMAALGDPTKMLSDEEFASYVEEQLESTNRTRRAAIIAWMQPAVVDLALSANGTCVIQKALEVTGVESQVALSKCLHGRVRQLLDSPHGSQVLQESIVMMPPHAFQFILHELSSFSEGWAGVAKHRFGHQVVERLLEHCESAEVVAPIVTAVVAEVECLAKHPFANFVVQHTLEYVPAQRHLVVSALIQVGVPQLAQHRVASKVIRGVFEHGGAKNQRAVHQAILSTPNAIVEVSCSGVGSFIVHRMLESLQEPLYSMALQQLAMAIPRLQASKHGSHIAARVSTALSRG